MRYDAADDFRSRTCAPIRSRCRYYVRHLLFVCTAHEVLHVVIVTFLSRTMLNWYL